MGRLLSNKKTILLFVGPALLVYVVVLLVPMLWSIVYTFFSGSPIAGFTFVGFTNYLKMFHDPNFISSLSMTLKYMIVVTGGQIVFGFLISLIYVFYIKKYSFLIRTLFFFPVVLPTVAVAEMFDKLFAITPQYGLFNAIFSVLHLHSLIQPWLGQPASAFWILCFMDIWRAIGFYAVLIYAGFVDIPSDIFEAARLDGAQGWQLSRFVILPLLRPVLISALIFSLNGTLKVFDSALALTNGGPGNATTPLAIYMYDTAFQYGNYGYGSTIAVFLLFMSLVVSVFVYRFARKDVA